MEKDPIQSLSKGSWDPSHGTGCWRWDGFIKFPSDRWGRPGRRPVDAQEMVRVLVLLQGRPTAHPSSPPSGITLADLLSPEDHADGMLCDLFRGEPCWIMD